MVRQGRWPPKGVELAEKTRPDLSRAALRSLIASLKINLGSRVLDVGCGSGQLAQSLHGFGADVLGLDESAERIEAARRSHPGLSFDVGRFPSIPLGHPDAEFEVILVEDLAPYSENLFSGEAFQMTADLLCSLRPNGRFAFLSVITPGDVDADARPHNIACYARHLSFFPGVCRVCHLPNGPTTGVVLSRILGQHSPSIWRLAVLKVPGDRIPAERWRELAREAARVSPEVCCGRAGSEAGSTEPPRAA